MSKKLTPWYPDSINPMREGVYEVRYGNFRQWHGESRRYSYFNGNWWGMRDGSIESAYRDRTYKAYGPVEKWRGLVKP